MNIFMNDRLLTPPEGLSREELWNYIEEQAAEQEETVLDVLSDGEALGFEDFLTVPDEIDVQVVTAAPYEVARQVLAALTEDTQALERDLRDGDFTVPQLRSFFEDSARAVELLSQCFPEWLADEAMAQTAREGADLCCGDDLPPSDELADVLDRWASSLNEGVLEMDLYWRADREEDE